MKLLLKNSIPLTRKKLALFSGRKACIGVASLISSIKFAIFW